MGGCASGQDYDDNEYYERPRTAPRRYRRRPMMVGGPRYTTIGPMPYRYPMGGPMMYPARDPMVHWSRGGRDFYDDDDDYFNDRHERRGRYSYHSYSR